MSRNLNVQPKEVTHRWKLALIITTLSIAGISLVAGLVIFFADDKAVASQSVLTSVLPLLAAWVSTVLAYYYSSESIEAATKSVKELMSPDEKLKTYPVVEEMIKLHEMVYFIYSEDLKVKEMLDTLKASGKGKRYPFLTEEKQPKFILHKSAIDEALVELSCDGHEIPQLTLKDLFEKVEGLKELAETSFGIVGEEATLADAKAEMQRIESAQDVFVTTTGGKDGKVIGWVTNRLIEKLSRI
jgi:SHS2 domain-containing protein